MQIPVQVERYVHGWSLELAWEWTAQSRTWRMTAPSGHVRFLKTAPADAAVPLRAEAARLRWARANGLRVPAVVAACAAGSAEWLLTEALPGRDATAADLQADPERLVPLLAAGLREFHQAPARNCPFTFGPDEAIASATSRVRDGLVAAEDMHPEHAHLAPAAALAELDRLRPDRAEDLVVCHGDYCLPNVLIADGQVAGFVDLGQLAVADPWSDLAVASWSVTWNLGLGWEDLFLDRYGAERDDQAIAFYRLLYDVTA